MPERRQRLGEMPRLSPSQGVVGGRLDSHGRAKAAVAGGCQGWRVPAPPRRGLSLIAARHGGTLGARINPLETAEGPLEHNISYG